MCEKKIPQKSEDSIRNFGLMCPANVFLSIHWVTLKEPSIRGGHSRSAANSNAEPMFRQISKKQNQPVQPQRSDLLIT